MASKRKKQVNDGFVPEGEPDTLHIHARDGETGGRALARTMFDPQARHAVLAGSFAKPIIGNGPQASVTEANAALGVEVDEAAKGDMTIASRMLTAQAVSLDAIFTEMARRSANNLDCYPAAVERYMRLALKAQTACRTALEALAKLHQPREQIVKHIHVNEGGQALVADQYHHYSGGKENGKLVEQSGATSESGERAALLSPDPLGRSVPVASGERKAAMPNARRD